MLSDTMDLFYQDKIKNVLHKDGMRIKVQSPI
jgi:hypothetical protein